MSNTLDQYREAKNNYLKLRNQARKELIARFNALAAELYQIQRELLEDFGEKVALPKPRKIRTAKVTVTPAPAPAPPKAASAPPSPKVVALEKQLEKQKQKLAETKAAGKPVKAIEDRIYEIEDELRLLKEGA
jgi:hypothetical protein